MRNTERYMQTQTDPGQNTSPQSVFTPKWDPGSTKACVWTHWSALSNLPTLPSLNLLDKLRLPVVKSSGRLGLHPIHYVNNILHLYFGVGGPYPPPSKYFISWFIEKNKLNWYFAVRGLCPPPPKYCISWFIENNKLNWYFSVSLHQSPAYPDLLKRINWIGTLLSASTKVPHILIYWK